MDDEKEGATTKKGTKKGTEKRTEKGTEKDKEDEKAKAPVSEICGNAQENAAAAVDDDSEVKPVEGFFLTSQRWH